MNKTWIWVLVVAVILGGGWYLMKDKTTPVMDADGDENTTTTGTMPAGEGSENVGPADAAPAQGVAPGEPNPSAQSSVSEKTFNVSASNFKFSLSEMKVKKGDKVTIVFKNTEGFHDFVIDEFKARTKQIKAPGEETITFVADKTGTFEYYCSVGTHRQMGMKGNLVVE